MKERWVMNDESGESMKPTAEVPLVGLGESELGRLVRGWRREAGSWFQNPDEGKHTGVNDLMRIDFRLTSAVRPAAFYHRGDTTETYYMYLRATPHRACKPVMTMKYAWDNGALANRYPSIDRWQWRPTDKAAVGMAIPTGMATVMNPYGHAVILGRFDFQTDVRLSGNAFPEVKRKGNEND